MAGQESEVHDRMKALRNEERIKSLVGRRDYGAFVRIYGWVRTRRDSKDGFSFIEVLSPCPVNYGRRNKEKPLETLRKYHENTIVKNGANPTELDVDFEKGVVLGKFIEVHKPTHDEVYRDLYWPKPAPDEELKAG